MMGVKARVFHPMRNVSLEDLVATDHFYRHVERTLDLTFVRDLVRDRYGITIFRRFFEAIVDRCQDDGLIWGKELYADATLVEANADRDKMLPRFAVEAHLRQLFGEAYQPPATTEASAPSSETTTPTATAIVELAAHPVLEVGADLT